MKRLANKILLIEVGAIVALVILSWVLYALGFEVHNILSGQGMRWLFRHHNPAWNGMLTEWLILLALAVGCLQESLLLSDLRAICHRPRINLPKRKRYALRIIGSLSGLIVIVLLIWTLFPSSVLLGVTGDLWPSPLADGIVPFLCLSIIVLSLIYAHASQVCKTWVDTFDLLPRGLSHYLMPLILWLVSVYLFNIIMYIFR